MIEKLYRMHYQELLHYVMTLTHSVAGAEDIVQETYMRAIGHADGLADASDAQRRAWLYRTAKNLFIDRFRRERHIACMDEEAYAASGFTEDDLSEVEVGQMMQLLSKEDRSMFWMRYMEGYNATEIGEIFGLPPGTVRSRLALARHRVSALYRKSIE